MERKLKELEASTKKELEEANRRFLLALREKDVAENQVAALTRLVTDQYQAKAVLQKDIVKLKNRLLRYEKLTGHENAESERQKEIVGLNEELDNTRTERDVAKLQVATLTRLITDQHKDMAELRKKYVRLQATLSKPEKSTKTDMPKIGAAVTRIEGSLVVLNVGKNDGVKVGYTFTIFEEDNFVAQVRVEKVMPTLCDCKVIFSQLPIKEGMSATTMLE